MGDFEDKKRKYHSSIYIKRDVLCSTLVFDFTAMHVTCRNDLIFISFYKMVNGAVRKRFVILPTR